MLKTPRVRRYDGRFDTYEGWRDVMSDSRAIVACVLSLRQPVFYTDANVRIARRLRNAQVK